jgi:hypothetical protein
MREMFRDLYFGTIDMWKNDRKEFWETYLGMGLVMFVFWVCLWVVPTIMG